MRALCHHYGVELQHFSPNAITVAMVFAAVQASRWPASMLAITP
jgi:hypothetical protein